MNMSSAYLLRTFVTGLLAALPLAATIAIFWWAASLLFRWFGPDSAIGGVMVAIGLGVTGSELVGYVMGVGLVAAAIFGLGLVVQAGLQHGASKVLGAVLQRIPLVRTVYELVTKMVGLFAQREQDGTRSMRAVWCHFGGPGGAAVLALLSTPKPIDLGGRNYLAVLVPTAPVPVGGGLLFVPEDWITPAEVGMEALTSIYVSMGVTSPQHLPPGRQASIDA
ncbi:MAG: DUF502 domain-containing protein [Rubrivivax sp.]|nr:DUF502 domain-containing protein [Rubrivivax sp.]